MIYHYLKIAFRNLIKYKTQSIVSIVGLAIGFTCFALSVLWIRYEMTYDDFHEGSERIYLAGNKFALQGDGFSYLSSSLLFFSNAYMSGTQRGRRLDFRIERQRAQSKGIVVGKAD